MRGPIKEVNPLKVIIHTCNNENHWYAPNPLRGKHLPIIADVELSPIEGEYRIIRGDHKGKHVAIADCSEIELEASA